MNFEYRQIEFGSVEYDQELELRYRVLREPLQLPLSESDKQFDREETHLGVLSEGQLVGCCLLRMGAPGQPPGQAKMRQVAISPELQGKGVGAALVRYFENFARARGATEVVMDARVSAIGFYEKLGYVTTSELFTQVTVPHKKMRKSIS